MAPPPVVESHLCGSLNNTFPNESEKCLVELRDLSTETLASEVEPAKDQKLLSTGRAGLVIFQVSGLQFFSSFSNGIVVIALPAIGTSLGLQDSLLAWPTSVYSLTAGTCYLLAGCVADVVGRKRMILIGSLLAAFFSVGCGLSQTGGEIIAFRALQGVANAMYTPASVAVLSNNLQEGRPRNVGFACLGSSQALGFSSGLVLTGVLTDTVGWRPAFYLPAIAPFALSLLGFWALPQDSRPKAHIPVLKRLLSEIDWVGVLLASMGLATLSYVLASLSADMNSIHDASSIVLLIVSGISVPAFIIWMKHQVMNKRPALIPNSLWSSHVFTSSCIMVLLTNALINCMELYSSLFFQQVQGASALGASVQVLPSLVAGSVTNLMTGIFVNRMPVFWTMLLTSVISTVSPLLMAIIRDDQPYWENAFFAQLLSPISCDMLFTVGLLIVSDVFSEDLQALSGAVFNTCAQLGSAIGLSVTQVIAASATAKSSYADKSSPGAVSQGYKAAYWTIFGWMICACVTCAVGLRRVGSIGLKKQ